MILNSNKIILNSFILLIIDSIYLYFSKNHYINVFYNITGKPMRFSYIKAILSYLCILIAYNYFIANKNIKSLGESFLLGSLLYGTFNFTLGALTPDYDNYTILRDTLWGGILFFLITLIKNLLRI